MKKIVITLILALSFTACGQDITAEHDHSETDNHNHEKMSGDMHDHSEKLEITDMDKIPTVKLTVEEDKISGWNVKVETTNFKFTPENASSENIEGEGHAHLYVNDKKIARLYSNWYHIADLPKGKNMIKVSLNANNHATLTHKGEEIANTVEVEFK